MVHKKEFGKNKIEKTYQSKTGAKFEHEKKNAPAESVVPRVKLNLGMSKPIPVIGPIPPDKKEEIQTKFALLTKGEENQQIFEDAKMLIERLFNEKTPTWKFQLRECWRAFFKCSNYLPEEKLPLLDEIGTLIETTLYQRGFRDDISTWQEHRVIGSTVGDIYSQKPYVPIGVLKGDLTVDEAQTARELQFVTAARAVYYGLENTQLIRILHEPLDAEGRTVRDPRVVDMKKFEDFFNRGVPLDEAINGSLVPFRKMSDFPAHRG